MNQEKQQKALIYCRVSSDKQVKEGHGLDSQEHRCRQYAKNKGYLVEKVFSDEGISGSLFERPAIQEILVYLDKNIFENYIVIFDNIDRIARNIQAHWKIRKEFESREAKVESPNFKFEENPEGRFIETILAGKAELDRDQNARQVKQKMKARMEDGYYCLAKPIGYEYIKTKEKGKILKKIDSESKIIKQALEGFAKNRFIRQKDVQQFLIKKNFHNGKLKATQVKNVLTDIIYTGYIEYAPWQIPRTEGKHEAIINIKTFETIQEKLEKKERRERKTDNSLFPLRRLVVCSHCGKPMTASRVRGKLKYYSMYTCGNSKCSAKPKNIQKHILEENYISLLKKISPEKEILELTKTISLDVWKKSIINHKETGRVIKKEIKKKELQIENCMESISKTSSDIMIEKYEEKVKKIDKEIKTLKNKQDSIKEKNFEEALSVVLDFIGTPHKYWQMGNIQAKNLIHSLVFEENPSFDLQNGFGTPRTSIVFQLKKTFQNEKSPLVDLKGFEPLTPCLQSRCSSQLSYRPIINTIYSLLKI